MLMVDAFQDVTGLYFASVAHLTPNSGTRPSHHSFFINVERDLGLNS